MGHHPFLHSQLSFAVIHSLAISDLDDLPNWMTQHQIRIFTAPKLSRRRDWDTVSRRSIVAARSDEMETTLKIPILSTWSPPYGYTSTGPRFFEPPNTSTLRRFCASRLTGQVINLWRGYSVRWPGAIPRYYYRPCPVNGDAPPGQVMLIHKTGRHCLPLPWPWPWASLWDEWDDIL